METSQLLLGGLAFVPRLVHGTLKDLPLPALTYRGGPDANTISWIVWHLTRMQDSVVASVAGTPQLWVSEGWVDRFGLPFDAAATGFGQSTEEVGKVAAPPELLLGYLDATSQRTAYYVGNLHDVDFDRVVDETAKPPATVADRLTLILADGLAHAGQADYVAGTWRSLQKDA
jgi:hypothetical protein